MHRPKFTVIVPVYNVSECLRTCLDSLLRQTIGDWEAICVDDGSTDDSGAILDEYAANDSRFRIVHQQNGGVSSARNAALDLATGEWIAYLDGDDFYVSTMLETLLRGAEASPNADMVSAGVQLWRVRTRYKPEDVGVETILDFDVSSYIPDCLWCGFSQYAYRKRICGDLRFGRHAIGEDLLYLAQNFCHVSAVAAVNTVGYVYRQRDGSAMRSALTETKLRDILITYREILAVMRIGAKSSGIANMIAGSLIEYCSSGIVRIPCGESRNALIDKWCDALQMVLLYSRIHPFDRCRIKLLCRYRNIVTILAFSYLPYILRRKYEGLKFVLKKIPMVHYMVLLRRKERIAREVGHA